MGDAPHGRHLYVNTRALKHIDDAIIGAVFGRFVEKLQGQGSGLVIVDDSEGVVAFGEESCDCETSSLILGRLYRNGSSQ